MSKFGRIEVFIHDGKSIEFDHYDDFLDEITKQS